jgi:glycosyltransferase involved in cell wall biosynthesis
MGIDLLLRAFAGSRAREHGWSIDIVGTGSQELSLRGLAEELGLSDSVTFHGRVSEPEKVELLEAATLSILPTRALEGFGLATVEAMALGVVPIVTSAGASPEVVQDLDGRLVCDPTADSIRTALDYWAVDASSETIRRISVACRERAKRYGWQSVFTAYQELVTRLSQPAQRA